MLTVDAKLLVEFGDLCAHCTYFADKLLLEARAQPAEHTGWGSLVAMLERSVITCQLCADLCKGIALKAPKDPFLAHLYLTCLIQHRDELAATQAGLDDAAVKALAQRAGNHTLEYFVAFREKLARASVLLASEFATAMIRRQALGDERAS